MCSLGKRASDDNPEERGPMVWGFPLKGLLYAIGEVAVNIHAQARQAAEAEGLAPARCWLYEIDAHPSKARAWRNQRKSTRCWNSSSPPRATSR